MMKKAIMQRTLARSVAVGLALGTVACGDALEGEWEAKQAVCDKHAEFSIDSDLKGEGSMPAQDAAGACLDCDFDVEAEESGTDEYDLEVTFDTCAVDGKQTVTFECELEDDGEELECVVGGNKVAFKRVE